MYYVKIRPASLLFACHRRLIAQRAPLSRALSISVARMASISYPDARKEEVVEDHFGRKVVEHYRWLEDPDSAETRAWVEAQQAVHASYSGRFNDTRGKVRARLEALYNYEVRTPPFASTSFHAYP